MVVITVYSPIFLEKNVRGAENRVYLPKYVFLAKHRFDMSYRE